MEILDRPGEGASLAGVFSLITKISGSAKTNSIQKPYSFSPENGDSHYRGGARTRYYSNPKTIRAIHSTILAYAQHSILLRFQFLYHT
jgi:hypothetical protein